MTGGCPRCKGLMDDWFGQDRICVLCGYVAYGPEGKPPVLAVDRRPAGVPQRYPKMEYRVGAMVSSKARRRAYRKGV